MRLLSIQGALPVNRDHVIARERSRSAERVRMRADTIGLFRSDDERRELILAATRVIKGEM